MIQIYDLIETIGDSGVIQIYRERRTGDIIVEVAGHIQATGNVSSYLRRIASPETKD